MGLGEGTKVSKNVASAGQLPGLARGSAVSLVPQNCSERQGTGLLPGVSAIAFPELSQEQLSIAAPGPLGTHGSHQPKESLRERLSFRNRRDGRIGPSNGPLVRGQHELLSALNQGMGSESSQSLKLGGYSQRIVLFFLYEYKTKVQHSPVTLLALATMTFVLISQLQPSLEKVSGTIVGLSFPDLRLYTFFFF